ncbi:hypothetical protein [Thalassoglobus polymorphus]|uniref:Uncharacterized protein n=1 Tax=Thalassoglobus polymorphus TaxID=2527994 RepID=A0A517QRR5_9PLAN|nr:hypothetical protein [Thalassoglobus polymorphus]QDT34324.1 hypothetical protein Mal48_35840 [Thalassoglobus polymorphus]
MHLTFHCPKCDRTTQTGDIAQLANLSCSHCDWERPIPEGLERSNQAPSECFRCGNSDLWRQKNFPQTLGFLFVALGAITSSIAWMYYKPILALSILMGFALLDMILYIVMPDVLVCYRCRTKHHDVDVSQHGAFDHELGEKYRQEKIRQEEAEQEQAKKSLSQFDSEGHS